MKTLKLLSLLFVCWQQLIFTQTTVQSPNYVPQSPQAAAFARYGEIPVDYSTGVPKIEIPIHTIKLGNITVPINISYHASGIKMRDLASETGLGWVVNTGGVITANIIGIPDVLNERPFNYKQASDIATAINNTSGNNTAAHDLALSYFNDITLKDQVVPETPDNREQIDFYSDRFSYSLPTGESGVFRKDFVTGAIKLLPYQPIKVINFDRYNITILSANGTKFIFKCLSSRYDCWFLDQIILTNADIIQYYYHGYNISNETNISYSVYWDYNKPHLEEGPDCPHLLMTFPNVTSTNVQFRYNGSTYMSVLIDSIVTKNEGVYFTYANDRLDMGSAVQKYRLSDIKVKDKCTKGTIKAFNFNQTYFGSQASGNLRLRLDNVLASGSGSVIERYGFTYNSINLPPRTWFSEDYWGYYNGKINPTLLPDLINTFGIPNFYGETGNMEPDTAYSRACILNEIQYPTGGKTIFEYEANGIDAANNGGVQKTFGGLRVKKITSYKNATSKAFTKTYKYSNEVYKDIYPWSYKYSNPQYHYVYYNSCEGTEYQGYESNLAFSNSMLPITFYNGASIMYQEVTEYFGDETTNIGKNVYDYDCTKWEENVFNCNEETYPMYFKQFQNDYGNYQPLLTSTTTYKNNNGQYETAKSVSNNYSEFKIDEFNTGLTFGSNIIIEGWGSMLGEVAFNYYDGNSGAYFSSLNYCDTKGHQDASLLTSSIETEYTNGQPVFTKNTEYAYDNYTQVATRTTSTSKNVDLTTNYNYPYDFKSEASPNIYNTMVDRNMLSFVVKQSDLAGTQPIQTVQTNYYNPNSNIIAPSTVNLGVGSNTPETRLRYYDYDNKGNVLCVSKENDVKNSYIWGYNQTYPIVKAENTTNVALASALTAATSDLETLLKNVGDMTSTTQRNTWKTFSSSLRSSLPGALVTMYTYKPLVGMTSSTDPNGVTSYYEYDTFGRLQYIKDDDGHILKTYEYHCQQ